jgi:hypothetical protein
MEHVSTWSPNAPTNNSLGNPKLKVLLGLEKANISNKKRGNLDNNACIPILNFYLKNLTQIWQP